MQTKAIVIFGYIFMTYLMSISRTLLIDFRNGMKNGKYSTILTGHSITFAGWIYLSYVLIKYYGATAIVIIVTVGCFLVSLIWSALKRKIIENIEEQ